MSSETQPTPGPWKAEYSRDGDHEWWDIIAPASGGDEWVVAEFINHEPDARLLVQGPALAAVLRAVVEDATRTDERGWAECCHCLSFTTSGDGHNDGCPIAEARRVLAEIDVVD